MIEYVEDRLGHDRRYSIDTAQGRGARLDARRTTSTTALEATVAWYRDNAVVVAAAQAAAEMSDRTCASSSPAPAARSGAKLVAACASRRPRRRSPADHAHRARRHRPRRRARPRSPPSSPTRSCTPPRAPPSTRASPSPTARTRVNAVGTRHVADAARRVGAHARLPLDRLRLRRHQGRRRTTSGTCPTRSRCTGARKLAGELELAAIPTPRSCASRGCAACTAPTW